MSVEGRANLGPDDGSGQRRPAHHGKKHRDRIPTPHEVERDLNEFAGLVPALKRSYRWAYNASLSATRGDSSQTGPAVADDGSVPGSTASVAASKERMRQRVRDAARKIDAARTDLRSALDTLERSMDSLSAQGYEPDRKWRPKLHRDELRPLEEAQQRREERGGGFGES